MHHHTSSAPPGTLTLAALADPDVVGPLTDALRDGAGHPVPRPQRALHPVHLAVDAVVAVVAAPSALNGELVEPGPDRLGAVPAALAEPGTWLADDVRRRPATPAEAGAAVRVLLEPVLALARLRGRIGVRTTDALVEDSLVARGSRLQRRSPDPLWLNAFLAGAGYSSPRLHRAVTTRPDDGPPVTLAARRVCCVLSARPAAGSCPTCPLLAHDVQVRETTRWLREVDDAEFADLAGRRRRTRSVVR